MLVVVMMLAMVLALSFLLIVPWNQKRKGIRDRERKKKRKNKGHNSKEGAFRLYQKKNYNVIRENTYGSLSVIGPVAFHRLQAEYVQLLHSSHQLPRGADDDSFRNIEENVRRPRQLATRRMRRRPHDDLLHGGTGRQRRE